VIRGQRSNFNKKVIRQMSSKLSETTGHAPVAGAVELFVDDAIGVLYEIDCVVTGVCGPDLDLSWATLPLQFRLEVAALLELALLERRGAAEIAPFLPSYQEALEELRMRVVADTESFLEPTEYPHLMAQLLEANIAHQRYSPEFDAVFVVADVENDALIESLARLVWETRHNRRSEADSSQGFLNKEID
jgi:hypothetical protein